MGNVQTRTSAVTGDLYSLQRISTTNDRT